MAFGLAAVVLVLLLFTLSVAIATAQEEIVRTVHAHLRDVRRWGGWILIGIGLWLLTLAILAPFFARIFPV
ncbi:MAG: hypothetical protein C4313_11250 [Thermoflexus sp.]|uniref:hypothetical protein n=1 Tax=Thermoflexus sp. TaxID=1969742 RepID=UPI003320CDDD